MGNNNNNITVTSPVNYNHMAEALKYLLYDIDKTAREQFELCSHKRMIDIYSTSAKTVDALMRLELPGGVDVEIKV